MLYTEGDLSNELELEEFEILPEPTEQEISKIILDGELMKYDLFHEGDKFINRDLFVRHVVKLSEIVINKHFNYITGSERQDLFSEAMIKALTLADQESFDKSKGSYKSYMYTGIRNEMHNYLYHAKKDSPVEDEVLLSRPCERSFNIDIRQRDIDTIFKEYPVDYLLNEDKIKAYLSHMGIGARCLDKKPDLNYSEKKFIVYFFWKLKELLGG